MVEDMMSCERDDQVWGRVGNVVYCEERKIVHQIDYVEDEGFSNR